MPAKYSLTWILTKNAIHPFRRFLSYYRRYRHRSFDRRARVHTTEPVKLQDLGLLPDRSVRYEPTPIAFFHSTLAKLDLVYPTTVFIDLGCGKGRTLLLASHYPFRSIIGVEISESLCQIAIANVQQYRSFRHKIPEVSVVCASIDEFDYDGCENARNIVVYLYNPCTAPVLKPALERLAQLAARGVSITIIYLSPTCNQLLVDAAWLERIRGGETFDEFGCSFIPYAIYCSARCAANTSQSDANDAASQVGPAG
jgi:SAM-dependent methyltransferase